jgi:alpha-aminoadipate carrier protein LysW
MADQNKQVICPDCGAEIGISENMMVGDILECQECGTEVEVLSLNPLKCRELIEEK